MSPPLQMGVGLLLGLSTPVMAVEKNEINYQSTRANHGNVLYGVSILRYPVGLFMSTSCASICLFMPRLYDTMHTD